MSTASCKPCAALIGLLLAGPAAAAEPPRVVELADARMVASESARKLLKYLAGCALPKGTVLTAVHDEVRYEFPGSIGLVPQWQKRGLTETEQRWLSACLLARTNHFGVPVQISMRSSFDSPAPTLHAIEPDERAEYRLEEGSFFGNLFGATPTRYVCGPAHGLDDEARLRALQRICTLPLDGGLSACRIRHVGPCGPSAYQQDGIEYRESITVFLRPVPMPPASDR